MKRRTVFSSLVAVLFLAGQGSAMAAPGDLLYTFRSPNPQAGECFGFSLDVAGDTIIVGAPAAYTNTIPGAVYVFDKATRAHRATLGLNEAALGSRFGIAVAGVGNDVLVGAYEEAGGGAIYLYEYGSNGYNLKQPQFPIRNPNSADLHAGFGATVAAIGDRMLVTAVHDQSDRGAVYYSTRRGRYSTPSGRASVAGRTSANSLLPWAPTRSSSVHTSKAARISLRTPARVGT